MKEFTLPATAYHGTTQAAAKQIRTSGFAPEILHGQSWGSGVYLTLSMQDASYYGDEIIKVPIPLKNPFVFDFDEHRSISEWYDEIQDDVGFPLLDEYGDPVTLCTRDPHDFTSRLSPFAVEAADAITAFFQAQGYDGIVVMEGAKIIEMVVFDCSLFNTIGENSERTDGETGHNIGTDEWVEKGAPRAHQKGADSSR